MKSGDKRSWKEVRKNLLEHGEKSIYCPGIISELMREHYKLNVPGENVEPD